MAFQKNLIGGLPPMIHILILCNNRNPRRISKGARCRHRICQREYRPVPSVQSYLLCSEAPKPLLQWFSYLERQHKYRLATSHFLEREDVNSVRSPKTALIMTQDRYQHTISELCLTLILFERDRSITYLENACIIIRSCFLASYLATTRSKRQAG